MTFFGLVLTRKSTLRSHIKNWMLFNGYSDISGTDLDSFVRAIT